jgi:hypothetical protein
VIISINNINRQVEIIVFWDVMPFSLADGYQRFREIEQILKLERGASLKALVTNHEIYSVISQKISDISSLSL